MLIGPDGTQLELPGEVYEVLRGAPLSVTPWFDAVFLPDNIPSTRHWLARRRADPLGMDAGWLALQAEQNG